MKKVFALTILMTLGAIFAFSAFADDDAWKYKAVWVRYGTSSEGITATKNKVNWGTLQECNYSVRIDLDDNTLVVENDTNSIHSLPIKILDINTDSNPAHLVMTGFDICYVELAAVDWYLYKGQMHYLYFFYDSGSAIEYTLQRID